jgi:hypothetical protein
MFSNNHIIDEIRQFYSFSTQIPTSTSISAFNVIITLTGGTTELYNNNGAGFPVQDSIMLQAPESCLSPTNSNQNLTVFAAVSSLSCPSHVGAFHKLHTASRHCRGLLTDRGLSWGTLLTTYDISGAQYGDLFCGELDFDSKCPGIRSPSPSPSYVVDSHDLSICLRPLQSICR